MSTITIHEGQLVTKDPADVKVYTFDWDTENLAVGVTIVALSSTWTITAIRPSKVDTALTKDQESILAGSRKTQLRLSGGTLGQTYEIANKIRTSETPFQEKERSFRVLIENK